MKKGLLFTCIIALLLWAMPSWAWYPDQEKDGIKDTVSPEEAKGLMKEGTYGMRKDYEPKPGFPWHEDLEKGTISGEQLMYLEDHAKEEYGFISYFNRRASLYLNSRGQYQGSGALSFRYFNYNEGRKIEDGDNYADVLSYHEGKIKAGDVFRMSRSADSYPPPSVGEGTLEWFYVKTPEVYKEPDRWKYFPGRRKVIRLGASSKANLRGGGMSTYDDTGGRMVWEHEHKIIGTDMINPQDHSGGRDGFWVDPTSAKLGKYITQPIECWVVLSHPRDTGYYLGQMIYWIQKSKDYKKIHAIRTEQSDRSMNLWKVRDEMYSNMPNPEDGEYDRVGANNWDLRRDFRHQSISNDEYDQIHNKLYWNPGGLRQFFSIDALRSEKLWDKPSSNKLRKKRWDLLVSQLSPPALMRDRFPEYRKIELRKEIEERIKKLVEKGILE